MSKVWQLLRNFDQAMIEVNGPVDGSPRRIGFGSRGSWRLIAVTVGSFLACVVLNLITGRGVFSFEALLVFGLLAVSISYSLLTPARK